MPPHYQRAEGIPYPTFLLYSVLPLPYFYSLRLDIHKVAQYRHKHGKLTSEETGRGTRGFPVIPLPPILIDEALICKNELSIPLTILNASRHWAGHFNFILRGSGLLMFYHLFFSIRSGHSLAWLLITQTNGFNNFLGCVTQSGAHFLIVPK